MDNSDGAGSVSDSSVFKFTGLSNGLAVSSFTHGSSTGTAGTFTPDDPGLDLPYRDNPTWTSVSFVGDGPSGDGGCTDCYYDTVATLNVPTAAGTPEPASLGLALSGFGAMVWMRRRRNYRN
jgi:PEP-CTERM motif-containing protein